MFIEVIQKGQVYVTLNQPNMLEVWDAIRIVQNKLDSKLVAQPAVNGTYVYQKTPTFNGWTMGITQATFDAHTAEFDAHKVKFEAHKADTSNPHNVTALQIGAVPSTGGIFTGLIRFNSHVEAHKYFEVANYDGTNDRMQSYFRSSAWHIQARTKDGAIDGNFIMSITGRLYTTSLISAGPAMSAKAASTGDVHYWLRRYNNTPAGTMYWDKGDDTLKIALYNTAGTVQIAQMHLKKDGNVELISGVTPVASTDIVPKSYVDQAVAIEHAFHVADSSAGPVTIKLPSSPVAGQRVKINSGDSADTNTVTVSGNGHNINSGGTVAQTSDLTTKSVTAEYIFDGSVWRKS